MSYFQRLGQPAAGRVVEFGHNLFKTKNPVFRLDSKIAPPVGLELYFSQF